MKSFGQIRDILEFARGFHRQSAELYKALSDESEQKTVKLLLDYMRRHERYLELCLDRYREQAPREILDAWMRCAPDESVAVVMGALKTDRGMHIDDVVALGRKIDRALVEMYRQLAENAESENVRTLFSSLMELEKREETILMENALALRAGLA